MTSIKVQFLLRFLLEKLLSSFPLKRAHMAKKKEKKIKIKTESP
jgi:hypothetical protein